MSIPINQIICGRNEVVMAEWPDNCIDLTVTSPPYDDLRTYKGYKWDFEAIARQLYRVMKPGGVVVWVVADETRDFCESLTSFKQAIYFVERCGFNLLDTMIYQKENYAPAYPSICRYANVFEYMFVLSKGKPNTFHPKQSDKARNRKNIGSYRQPNGTLIKKVIDPGRDTKDASNIWAYAVGGNDTNHPGTFPEKLAEDHILSWSNPGDIVLDPFCGSGTTPKMAIKHHRQFIGIDISEEYCTLARKRIAAVQPVLFAQEAL